MQQTELDILKEAYKELEIERDALKRDVERKLKKLETLADPQAQILELEADKDYLSGLIDKKNAVISKQAKQLENVRELVELGKATLNKIMEESE